MRRRSNIRIGATGLVALALATGAITVAPSCAVPEAPEKPAWDTDVYPILRGSCLHCHGAEYMTTANPWRFDVCSPMLFADVEATTDVGLGAVAIGESLKMDIDASKTRPKMPPAPAEPLGDYETKVLQNWLKLATAKDVDPKVVCKKQEPNGKPNVKLLKSRKEGDTAWLTLEVTDPDGDVVAGKISAGDASTKISKLGRYEVKIEKATSDDYKAKVSDGWDTFESDLN
jgi:hypothetical protein